MVAKLWVWLSQRPLWDPNQLIKSFVEICSQQPTVVVTTKLSIIICLRLMIARIGLKLLQLKWLKLTPSLTCIMTSRRLSIRNQSHKTGSPTRLWKPMKSRKRPVNCSNLPSKMGSSTNWTSSRRLMCLICSNRYRRAWNWRATTWAVSWPRGPATSSS